MDFVKLKTILADSKQPGYRFSQIASDVVSGRVTEFNDIFTIPQSLRVLLASEMKLISLEEVDVKVSKDKHTRKALLKLHDGKLIETVLMNTKPALWSVCLSCQVGCAMGCTFCATGKQGLVRNLSVEEICDQVLFWKQHIAQNKLKIRISNLVYMGMGEPFTNKEHVFDSIRTCTDPSLYGFGQRHISVSTAGVIPGIQEFATHFPQINLALSLHATNDSLRSRLMPINTSFPLPKLAEAVKEYLKTTNRQVMFEYLLLEGVNDSDAQALELVTFCKNNFEDLLNLVHINLIEYNPTGDTYKGSSQKRIDRFEKILHQGKVSVSKRKSLGQDIAGACGQLSGMKTALP